MSVNNFFCWISLIFVGFFKSSHFCVSLYLIQSQWKAFLLIIESIWNNLKPELINNTFLTLPLQTGSSGIRRTLKKGIHWIVTRREFWNILHFNKMWHFEIQSDSVEDCTDWKDGMWFIVTGFRTAYVVDLWNQL
jgi:hypothetical protein